MAALPDATFTDVLIDGRARVACALAVLPHRTPPSAVLLLHDAERHVHAPMYDWYDTLAVSAAARGPPPRLAVPRRKARARLPPPLPVSAATARARLGARAAGRVGGGRALSAH